MIDIVEILIHWYAGRSQNELAASLGVDRKTLRKYTAPARAAGIEPGGPPMAEADWRTLATGWFPGLVDTRLRQVSWPGIECHRDYIAAQLKAGVTVATISQFSLWSLLWLLLWTSMPMVLGPFTRLATGRANSIHSDS